MTETTQVETAEARHELLSQDGLVIRIIRPLVYENVVMALITAGKPAMMATAQAVMGDHLLVKSNLDTPDQPRTHQLV